MEKRYLKIDSTGKMFVVSEYSLQSTPIIARVSWPVVAIKGNPYRGAPVPKDGDLLNHNLGSTGSNHINNDYTVYIESMQTRGTLEEIPFPCPKVRKGIETRYYFGEWQKYSKVHGWIKIA